MSVAVHLVVGSAPDAIVKRAVGDLRFYLSRLFGADARIVATEAGSHPRLLVGTERDEHVRLACPDLPHLSDQGHQLRRIDEDTMVLGGGAHRRRRGRSTSSPNGTACASCCTRMCCPRRAARFTCPTSIRSSSPSSASDRGGSSLKTGEHGYY